MPTGTQQVIEGLLCIICENVLFEASDMHNEICENCSDNHFFSCSSCCDTFVSDGAARSVVRAAELVGIYSSWQYEASDTCEALCGECGYICENCGCRHEYEGSWLDCCEQGGDIHNYSYKPYFYYYSMEDGNPKSSTWTKSNDLLYMGVELEINKMVYLVSDFLEDCTSEQNEFIYFKEDGSIGPDGVELVTMPATIDAFSHLFPFDALDSARQRGARSFGYQNCGFHIHVSRSAFTATHMWKFVRFQLKNPSLCQRVAQREESSYASWYFEDSERRSLPEYVKGKKSNGRRYLAINFQNRATVELRYFKGNILKGAILKNLEFVQSMYDYTKMLSVNDVMHGALTEESYNEWFFTEENIEKYPNLHYFFTNDSSRGGE
jgi:hypothetical protein